MASPITTIVYSTVYWGADQRKCKSSASLALVRGIHRWPVNSPHQGPVTRKVFPFDDVTMDSKDSKDFIPASTLNQLHTSGICGLFRLTSRYMNYFVRIKPLVYTIIFQWYVTRLPRVIFNQSQMTRFYMSEISLKYFERNLRAR